MTDERRSYRMTRRAESQLETRRRITESAVALHGTLGPARTSMKAVAERAGVRRSTVYRHFPDEIALLQACSAHWIAANPRPDLEGWARVADPSERLALALAELYAYYARTAPMLANLLRDEQTMEPLRERFSAFHGYLAAALEVLMRGRRERGRARRRAGAAIGHALQFPTWRSLVAEQGLDPVDAVSMMGRLVDSAAPSP